MTLQAQQTEVELSEARLSLNRLELGAQALITELRLATDPILVDRFSEMDKAAHLAVKLNKKWQRARMLQEKIHRLEKALVY